MYGRCGAKSPSGRTASTRSLAEWGFSTHYLLFEDIEQTELRGPELHRIRNVVKLAALYNAYAIRPDANTYFFNARYGNKPYWREMAPRFSTDFADIVYLGSTVTYIALQLAFYLGCDPVYLIGVDHDYGELSKRYPPGKITITEENYPLVQQCHFSGRYYTIGDQIGVPDVARQEQAYAMARSVYESHGRQVLNASLCSKLDAFERADYASLF